MIWKRFFLLVSFLLWSHQAIAALAMDGNATASGGSAVSLTTTQTNDIIVLFIISGGAGPCNATQVSDTSGLTWITRLSDNKGTTSTSIGYVYAVSSGVLTADSITVSGGGGCTSARTIAFAISGANTSSPFDSNGSLPGNSVQASGTSNSFVGSTTNANDMLLAMIRCDNGSTLVNPTSFTSINAGGSTNQNTAQLIVSSTQSSVTYTYSGIVTGPSRFYFDAIKASSGPTIGGGAQRVPTFGGFP